VSAFVLVMRYFFKPKATLNSGPRRNDGTRRTTRYDIDMVKCIYCGLCQEAYRLCLRPRGSGGSSLRCGD
jgi:hypothetical protein